MSTTDIPTQPKDIPITPANNVISPTQPTSLTQPTVTASTNPVASPVTHTTSAFNTESSLDGSVNPLVYDPSSPNYSSQDNYPNYPNLSNTNKVKQFSSNLMHPTKATLWSAIATILTIGLMSTVMLSISLTRQNQIAKQLAATPLYPNTSIPLTNVGNANNLSLGQLIQIDLNGRVNINGSLVLTPQETPTNATNGELYYDQTTGNVAYYNGNEFKALVTSNQTVANIGGLQGSIALGDGLTVANGRLSLTNPPPNQ